MLLVAVRASAFRRRPIMHRGSSSFWLLTTLLAVSVGSGCSSSQAPHDGGPTADQANADLGAGDAPAADAPAGDAPAPGPDNVPAIDLPVDVAMAPDATGTDVTGADGTAADTWDSYAQGFFVQYCNHCHSAGGAGYRNGDLDFTIYAKVMANAAEIRCGTAATQLSGCTGFPPPKQFPIAAPYPADAERDRIVAWIEAGLPQ
jgi:hypothetical protein